MVHSLLSHSAPSPSHQRLYTRAAVLQRGRILISAHFPSYFFRQAFFKIHTGNGLCRSFIYHIIQSIFAYFNLHTPAFSGVFPILAHYFPSRVTHLPIGFIAGKRRFFALQCSHFFSFFNNDFSSGKIILSATQGLSRGSEILFANPAHTSKLLFGKLQTVIFSFHPFIKNQAKSCHISTRAQSDFISLKTLCSVKYSSL